MKPIIVPPQISDRCSFLVKHPSSKRIKWFSLATCLGLLLMIALALVSGVVSVGNGAHAAQGNHAISAHKHVVSSHKHAPAPPRSGKLRPVLSAAPLSLSFAVSLKQTNVLPVQTVSIKNTGVKVLYWHVLVNPSTASWLSVVPLPKSQSLGISLASNQLGQLTVSIKPALLMPGGYTAQIVLSGTDQQMQPAGGNPQTITVILNVTA